MSDKPHKASAKRLKDAREEGNVAQAQSVPHLLAFGAVFELIVATSDQWMGDGAALLGSTIARLGASSAADRIGLKDLLIPLGGVGLAMVLVALVAAAALALIGNMVQTGVVVATKSFLRFERLNPVSHAQQMFSAEQLQNLVVSMFKATAIFGCVAVGVLLHFDSLLHLASGTLMQAAQAALQLALVCERLAMLVLIVFVAIDWIIRKRSHAEQLRMTHQEQEREQKDQFGDKHVRAGRNDFRRDMLGGALTENTRKANAVVTNPTHFAVALLYDPALYPLPLVLARGTDEQAALMRRIAREAGIPLIRSPQLARSLYATGRPWHPVPRMTLKAVAAVYRVVAEIQAGERRIDQPIELDDEPPN